MPVNETSTRVDPWRWSVNQRKRKRGRTPLFKTKSYGTLEGRIAFDTGTTGINPQGFTGSLWRADAPTDWARRYNKAYELPITGILNLSGETGYQGSTYDVAWRLDMSGITGIEHGQFYGMEIALNPTAGGTTTRYEATAIVQVKDDFK